MKANKFTRGEGLFEEFLTKKRSNFAEKMIPDGLRSGRVLDIGCGEYPYFLTQAKFSEKYGLDYSTDLSKISDKSIIIKKANVEEGKLPFKSDFFNAVVMLAVFEHINKDRLSHVLGEVNRVLKKNGVFVITTPSPWSDRILHFMARFGLISKEEIHDHKHNLTREKIENILINSGFSREKITKGYFELSFNMWFVAKK